MKLQNSGYSNIGVDFYKNGQILVQIMVANHFESKGLILENIKDLCVLIDFNKNRTETWQDFKNKSTHEKLAGLVQFEEPKGVFCFVKNVGQNPEKIEEALNTIVEEVFTFYGNDKLEIQFHSS